MSIPIEKVFSGGQVQIRTTAGSLYFTLLGADRLYVRAVGGESDTHRTVMELVSQDERGLVLKFEDQPR